MNLYSKKGLKTGALILILFAPVFLFYLLYQFGESHFSVPIYFPKNVNKNGDTLYHKVPSFSFVDQNGNQVTDELYKNKLYVTDFFFTTCLGPCPKMSEYMAVLQDKLKNEDRVLLLSHTVDPIHDSASVLKNYANLYNVDYSKWRLVTGEKEALYKQAREGYFLVTSLGDGGENDFIHSQKFVLVDDRQRIRGYYDGTDINEIKRLLDEIAIILRERELENVN